jgi:peptidoglycan/LPS O-acetylase OafA/YrhL
MKKRNVNLDLLRLLGVLIIIISHSNPPGWLFQLRNFGTPLLIIASALTYRTIYENRVMDIIPFYKKRILRLILPVWIFLSVFFFVIYLINKFLGQAFPFDLKTIVESYFLIEGIGFVWIFKVYLILAILTPLALFFYRKDFSLKLYFSVLILCYLIYEIMLTLTHDFISSNEVLSYVSYNIIFIVIPYALVYFYGFRLKDIKTSNLIILQIFLLAIFIVHAVYYYRATGGIVSTQHFKYPPTIYYLSYAIFMTNNMFLIIKSVNMSNVIEKAIIWLSSNSFWFYLWHIVAFYLWQQYFPNEYISFTYFIYKSIFMLGFGCLMVSIQIKILDKIKRKYDNPNPYYKTLISALS